MKKINNDLRFILRALFIFSVIGFVIFAVCFTSPSNGTYPTWTVLCDKQEQHFAFTDGFGQIIAEYPTWSEAFTHMNYVKQHINDREVVIPNRQWKNCNKY